MSEAATHVGSGKVRELYALDHDRLLLVASDRISTFDVVLPTEIPDKGRVLTGLSGFWFTRTRELVANHLLALRPDGSIAPYDETGAGDSPWLRVYSPDGQFLWDTPEARRSRTPTPCRRSGSPEDCGAGTAAAR